MRLGLLLPLAVIAVAGVVAGLAALGGHDEAARMPPQPTFEHQAPIPRTARAVIVSRAMPMPSAHERRLSTMLEAGVMPHRQMMGMVMTDTDCAPDARMISRCRNVVRLADGQRIVLRHPHDMTKIPCLAPGERVRLVPAAM